MFARTSAKLKIFSKNTLIEVKTNSLLSYECFFPTLPCAFTTPTENAIFFTADQYNLPRCITNEIPFKHRVLLLSTLSCSGNKSTEPSMLLNGMADISLFFYCSGGQHNNTKPLPFGPHLPSSSGMSDKARSHKQSEFQDLERQSSNCTWSWQTLP